MVGKTGIIHVWAISKPDVGSVGIVVCCCSSRLGLKCPNITSPETIVSPLGGISTLAPPRQYFHSGGSRFIDGSHKAGY